MSPRVRICPQSSTGSIRAEELGAPFVYIMALEKSQKQGIGLFIGSIGALITGATLLTNTNNWLWISISAILIIGGSIFWFLNK
jgi:hypothetical protein